MRQPKTPLIVKSLLTATYNCTDSFVNIPGLVVRVPKDGYYEIRSLACVIVGDDNAGEGNAYPQFAKNGVYINSTVQKLRHNDDSAGQVVSFSFFCSTIAYFKKDEIISLQIKHNAGDNSQVYFSTSAEPGAGYIEIEKIEKPHITKTLLTATYIVGTSYANVPGLVIVAPKNGYYKIKGIMAVLTTDDSSTAASSYVRLTINGLHIEGITQHLYHGNESNAQPMQFSYYCEAAVYLKKDDEISFQVKMDAGDNCQVYFSSGSEPSAGFIELDRLTGAFPIITKSLIKAAYTITSSQANIPGLAITVPKEGYYRVRGLINVKCYDASGVDGEAYPRFAKDGVYINGTVQRLRMTNDINAQVMYINYFCSMVAYFKKDEVVSIQIAQKTGDNCTVLYSDGISEGFIEIERI